MVYPGRISLAVVLLVGLVSSDHGDHPDRVINLPGAPAEPSFPLYSGYLKVDEGYTQHKMFYVLCEAIHIEPSEAPLLVWLNGGPGASSLFGLFLEHGPYLIDAKTGELKYNDFSWNQYANVLYLESPSSVGFSYSTNNTSNATDDLETARLNRRALHDFMTRVHPRYAARDFYLTGESYAGVYIPHLAREILNHNEEFRNDKFKGIAMINALVDYFSNEIATAMHLYSLGMIPQEHGEKLFSVWHQIVNSSKAVNTSILKLKHNENWVAVYDFTLECNQIENDTLWHIAPANTKPSCQTRYLTESYLNQDDVQMALHARTKDEPVVQWISMNRDVRNHYVITNDTIPLYNEIIALAQPGFRILFFTGDTDLVCPPLHVAFGAERIAKGNQMKVSDATEHQSWHYLGDLGGVRTTYYTEKPRNFTKPEFSVIMDVLTVRGAGHMIPISQPDRAFQIINNFITAEQLTAVDYSKLIPRR